MRLSEHSSLEESYRADSDRLIMDMHDVDLLISEEAPLSIEEAKLRVSVVLTYIEGLNHKPGKTSLPVGLVDEITKEYWDRVPEAANLEDAREIMQIVCPNLLQEIESTDCATVLQNKGQYYVIFKASGETPSIESQHSQETFTARMLITASGNDRSRIFHRYAVDDSHVGIAHPLPTMEEIEQHYFNSKDIEGRFLPPNQDGEPSENPSDGILSLDVPAEGNGNGIETRPRLQQLKKVLLRNGLQAVFYWDGKPSQQADANEDRQHNYDQAEPGHYVVVTLPEIGMQILISDDVTKGTYIVRNVYDPKEYTQANTEDLGPKFGATSVTWRAPEQFAHGLETTVLQQRDNPKRVWAVNTNYSTVINALRDEREAVMQALHNDFANVAERANRSEKPWTLRPADFARIKSGDFDWSFGGSAHGSVQLDRLAREFGLYDYAIKRQKTSEVQSMQAALGQLDESDPEYSALVEQIQLSVAELEDTQQNLHQYHFRSLILKILLWEMYPEFRAAQQQRDEKKVAQLEEQAVEG